MSRSRRACSGMAGPSSAEIVHSHPRYATSWMRARGGVVEVDEGDRPALAEDVVARRRVVVADDLLVAGERGAGGRVVQGSQQPRGVDEDRVGEVVEVRRHPAGEVAEDLAAV